MLKEFSRERSDRVFRRVISGAAVGGVLGALAGTLNKIGILTVLGIGNVLSISLLDSVVTGTLLGIFAGAGICYVTGLDFTRDRAQIPGSDSNSAELELREEKLDIMKRSIRTGEVKLHKEVITEERNITVPVTREELVIEKKVLGETKEGTSGEHSETIRIPISEERIEVIKHPEKIEDVNIYTHQFQNTERVEAYLKKEKVKVKAMGDVQVINIETENTDDQ